MSERCICESQGECGPSTHRGVKHLSTCPHSDLRLTTKRYKRRKIKAVPGTRRLIAVDLDEPERKVQC